MTTTFYTSPSAATMPARNFRFRSSSLIAPTFAVQTPQLKTKAPEKKEKAQSFAAYVDPETGFQQIPRDFFEIQHLLEPCEVGAYMALLGAARTLGEKSGHSWHKREFYADCMGRSVDTFDKGANGLIKKGMARKIEHRNGYGHNDPNEYVLLPPSRWFFEGRKNAAPSPSCSEKGAERKRPKQEEPNKKKSTKHHAGDGGAKSQSENVSAPSDDAKRLANELCTLGFSRYNQALSWATSHPSVCREALKKVSSSKKKIGNKGGLLNDLIVEGIAKENATPTPEQPTPAPKPQSKPVPAAEPQVTPEEVAPSKSKWQAAAEVFADLDEDEQELRREQAVCELAQATLKRYAASIRIARTMGTKVVQGDSTLKIWQEGILRQVLEDYPGTCASQLKAEDCGDLSELLGEMPVLEITTTPEGNSLARREPVVQTSIERAVPPIGDIVAAALEYKGDEETQ